MAGMARLVGVRHGWAWPGKAGLGSAWQGTARPVPSWLGKPDIPVRGVTHTLGCDVALRTFFVEG